MRGTLARRDKYSILPGSMPVPPPAPPPPAPVLTVEPAPEDPPHRHRRTGSQPCRCNDRTALRRLGAAVTSLGLICVLASIVWLITAITGA